MAKIKPVSSYTVVIITGSVSRDVPVCKKLFNSSHKQPDCFKYCSMQLPTSAKM